MSPKLHVLCVASDPDNRSLLALMLERAGFKVQTADSLAGGISAARLERYDLCLLDGLYHDGNGFDLCRQLRLLGVQTPVLFFSALARQTDRVQGLEAGGQEYLVKPDDLDNVIPAVERWAARSALAAI